MVYVIGRIKNLKYIKENDNNRIEFKFVSNDCYMNNDEFEYYYRVKEIKENKNFSMKHYNPENSIFKIDGDNLLALALLCDYQNKKFKIEFDESNFNVSSIEILD